MYVKNLPEAAERINKAVALQLAPIAQAFTSANGRVVIEAKEELLLKCGGSYLRMSAAGIEDGTRGERTIKSNGFSRKGPASMTVPEPLRNDLPPLPIFVNTASFPASRAAIPVGMPYQLFADGAPVKQGVMEESGYVTVEHREGTQSYLLQRYNWLRPHQFNDGLAPAVAEEKLYAVSGMGRRLQSLPIELSDADLSQRVDGFIELPRLSRDMRAEAKYFSRRVAMWTQRRVSVRNCPDIDTTLP